MSARLHPSGFRISDRPVAASFAHPYSFQLVTDHSIKDEATIPAFRMLSEQSEAWMRYWDESTTVAVLELDVEGSPAALIGSASKVKKEKKKCKGTNTAAAPDTSIHKVFSVW